MQAFPCVRLHNHRKMSEANQLGRNAVLVEPLFRLSAQDNHCRPRLPPPFLLGGLLKPEDLSPAEPRMLQRLFNQKHSEMQSAPVTVQPVFLIYRIRQFARSRSVVPWVLVSPFQQLAYVAGPLASDVKMAL